MNDFRRRCRSVTCGESSIGVSLFERDSMAERHDTVTAGHAPVSFASSVIGPMRDAPDAQPVRHGEQLDWVRLERWLRDQLPSCGIPGLDVAKPMDVAQFPGGHSNLTYLIRFGEVELVLRRPPFGNVPPAAHDVAREFRWLSAIHPVFPLAPRAYLLCEHRDVIGSAFYVMERRDGIVVRGEEPPSIRDNPAMRHRVGTALVDTLASLHRVDIEKA